jgi:hypothetical protein
VFGIVLVSLVVEGSLAVKALFAEGVFNYLTFLVWYLTHVVEVVLISDC